MCVCVCVCVCVFKCVALYGSFLFYLSASGALCVNTGISRLLLLTAEYLISANKILRVGKNNNMVVGFYCCFCLLLRVVFFLLLARIAFSIVRLSLLLFALHLLLLFYVPGVQLDYV